MLVRSHVPLAYDIAFRSVEVVFAAGESWIYERTGQSFHDDWLRLSLRPSARQLEADVRNLADADVIVHGDLARS